MVLRKIMIVLARGLDDLRNNSVSANTKMRKRVHVTFIIIHPGGHIGGREAEPQKSGRAFYYRTV